MKMNRSSCLFWNVDTQIDFVEPDGKLYVSGAELLKPNWKKLTKLAKRANIKVINSADYHFPDSDELDSSPDFVNTFPLHCMANTHGAEFIAETSPENPLLFNWDEEYEVTEENLNLKKNRNIVIRKDAFDVFKGNKWTASILKEIDPETVIVYGVTTNVCVDAAVLGLIKRVENVVVVEDAIKELPNIPLPIENWRKAGVKLMQLKEVEKVLDNKC